MFIFKIANEILMIVSFFLIPLGILSGLIMAIMYWAEEDKVKKTKIKKYIRNVSLVTVAALIVQFLTLFIYGMIKTLAQV